MVLPNLEYDNTTKQTRILVEPGERGIRASNSRFSWWGRSTIYFGKDGPGYLNYNSAMKYINKLSREMEIKPNSRYSLEFMIDDFRKRKQLFDAAKQGDRNAQLELSKMDRSKDRAYRIKTDIGMSEAWILLLCPFLLPLVVAHHLKK